MKPQWFGDSFDIVKRFFVENLNKIGYQVVVDPMLTDEWNGLENKFYKFLKAYPLTEKNNNNKYALLIDPDTGIGRKRTKQHVTIKCIATQLLNYDIVFSFDQSFSRAESATEKIKKKLKMLEETGNYGFYYDSHARFLFASKNIKILEEIKQQLLSTKLPESRFVNV